MLSGCMAPIGLHDGQIDKAAPRARERSGLTGSAKVHHTERGALGLKTINQRQTCRAVGLEGGCEVRCPLQGLPSSPLPLGGLNEMTRVVWCIHCEAECPTLPSLCSRNRHSNGLGKPVLWSLLTLQKCFHPSMTYW